MVRTAEDRAKWAAWWADRRAKDRARQVRFAADPRPLILTCDECGVTDKVGTCDNGSGDDMDFCRHCYAPLD